jgi:ADP-heptose:LPS heptosyltransferase
MADPAGLRIYSGILGQIGDIILFTATARRLKELFPNSRLTFAVSARCREAGELVAGLSYVDRLFITQHYFERLTAPLVPLWEAGWPVDVRGDDEVWEQRRHDLVFETRPRHAGPRWWEQRHLVAETAAMVGVPGLRDLRTEVALPPHAVAPPEARGRIVLHNDPAIDPRKEWPWEHVCAVVAALEPETVVLLGGTPRHADAHAPGALDLRGRTTLAEAAAIIRDCRCYVGIDSGLMWIAASLQVPTVGIYGRSYVPACEAFQPVNPRAIYLNANGSPGLVSPAAVLEALGKLLG